MNTKQASLGQMRLLDQLRQNRPSLPVFRDLFKDVNTAQAQTLMDAIGAALGILRIAELDGIKMASKDKNAFAILNRGSLQIAIDLNRMMAERDWMGVSTVLVTLSSAVDELRTRGKVFKKPEKGTKQARTTDPIEVRVVGMPKRKSAILIDRDASGEITGSIQTEQDAE
jgi:hypothetical protein